MPPRRRIQNRRLDSSDETETSGSDSADSVATVQLGSNNKKKATARKSSSPVKPTARKSASPVTRGRGRGRGRGRPVGTSKRQLVLTDSGSDVSDDSQSRNSVAPSNSAAIFPDSDESDSDHTTQNGPTNSRTPASQKTPARGRGRPKASAKQPRVSNSPVMSQPSTSGLNNHHNSDVEVPDSSSGSETPDSDYEIFNDTRKRRTKKKDAAPAKAPPKGKNAQNNTQGISGSKGANDANKRSKSFSQPKATQDAAFSTDLIETLAQKCVYFLLIEDQKKYAIKRKAIVQHVFKDEPYSPKLYTAVICKANSILTKTFGVEVMELENQKDNYLLINVLKRELGMDEFVEVSRLRHQQHGLILYLLTVIFMNGNTITEDELNRALKPLRIDLTSKRLHPIFGDIKKYITVELVKQMYLNYQCTNKDPPRFEITWGLRAKQEFDKKDLLNFACQILDDTTPESWILQYRDAEMSATPP